MENRDPARKFEEYLQRIKDTKDDKCWFCHKTPDKIRNEFLEYMKNPAEEYEGMDLDDLIIMTYKTQKPVCASCYFTIKQNPNLIKEIFEKPQTDIW